MDANTGYIEHLTDEELKKKIKANIKFVQMKIPPTRQQMLRTPPRVGRNELCPCGCGLKYKKCHGRPRNYTEIVDEKAIRQE